MILLDTSVLIDSFTGDRASLPHLRELADEGEEFLLSTIVMYEWLRGQRQLEELESLSKLIPITSTRPFEIEDATIAARLYKSLPRARSREADIAIAACAIRHEASLWTLNHTDFADIPGLKLYDPAGES